MDKLPLNRDDKTIQDFLRDLHTELREILRRVAASPSDLKKLDAEAITLRRKFEEERSYVNLLAKDYPNLDTIFSSVIEAHDTAIDTLDLLIVINNK